ncbi:MAG: DinB family protein [Anaerolineales bacterium]|nr:DinB family protein [Anaerolineales bacterium]
MAKQAMTLMQIYEGWAGHQTSLVHAIAPLTPDQLSWRPTEHLFSVGELARHISLGRLTWFLRMGAPGSATLAQQIDDWAEDEDGNAYIVESNLAIAETAVDLVHWLEVTGNMVAATLNSWPVGDLHQTYRHTWNGDVYDVSRQWTIWRILSHDIHHGGQIALMLGMQGIEAFELGDLFGHITLPPLAKEQEK